MTSPASKKPRRTTRARAATPVETKAKWPKPPTRPAAEELAAMFHTLSDEAYVRPTVLKLVLDISNSTLYRLLKTPKFPK